ncbi:tyrosine-protein phosphatase [Georgenia alba]|uniref:Tyrosine-protein phosphatase n=1 Tax=Georgenia alba TaxID=2233858 RepID=A0ABW2Q4I3_9MICO
MTTTTTVQLSAPVNLRDLGGIPIAGGVLREGFAIRVDDLSTVTEEVAATLVAGGLRSVIDLRSREEVALTGRGPLAQHPVAYHHIPLMVSLDVALTEDDGLGTDHTTFGEGYARLVERAAPQLVTALAVIALSPGATAFHCAAGKDRTGVLAASLLLALGASDEDVVADYALTGRNIDAIMTRLRPTMGVLMARAGLDLDAMAAAATGADFSDEAMRTMITSLRIRHGDPLAPLRAAGLGDELTAMLRGRALA